MSKNRIIQLGTVVLIGILILSCQKQPSACFEPSVPSISFIGGEVHAECTFTNCTTAGSLYTWDFGDGGSSTLVSPEHTYTSVGTYTVTLTAKSENGRKEDKTTRTVTVNGRVSFRHYGSYDISVQVGSNTQQGSGNPYYGDCYTNVNFSLPAGSYSYTAHEVSPGTQTWNGTFSISGQGCTVVDL